MKLSVYIVVHVDKPEDMILNELVDQEGSRPEVYMNLELAQKALDSYLEQGLEFTIKKIELRIE